MKIHCSCEGFYYYYFITRQKIYAGICVYVHTPICATTFIVMSLDSLTDRDLFDLEVEMFGGLQFMQREKCATRKWHVYV